MARVRNDIDFDHLIELYRSGQSLPQLAAEFGVGATTLHRRLVTAGIEPRGRRNQEISTTEILARYRAGESELAVAKALGVSRPLVRRRLLEAGEQPRNRGDSAMLRMSRTTSEERLELTTAAHEAARGRVKTEAEQIKRARSREANPPTMSVPEAEFATWLSERNIPYRREVAVDKYNVDFAIASVAVEILGGEWHGTRKKAARHSERTPHILGAGWCMLFIWATPTVPLTPAAADHAIALLESTRRDPSLIGEYRVISGEAHLLARGRAEDHERTGVPAPRRRRNAAR